MTADSRLTRQDGAVTNHDRPSQTNLCHQQTLLADAHVVADVHQVVDLGAVSHHGVIDTAAVDGAVGADFDVIADDAASDVRNLLVSAVFEDIAEPIAAEARALGARVIGGCCGTIPTEIAAIARAVEEERQPTAPFAAAERELVVAALSAGVLRICVQPAISSAS